MAKAVWLKNGNDKIYPAPYWPIGSIYISVVNTNPSQWFGGKWEALPGDYYLITTPVTQTTRGQGGSWYTNNTSLTINQIPSHNHQISGGYGSGGGYGVDRLIFQQNLAGQNIYTSGTGGVPFIQNTGGSQGHNHFHQPPYYQVWAWRRVS